MKRNPFTTFVLTASFCLLGMSGFAQRPSNENVTRLQTLLKQVSDTSTVQLQESRQALQINQSVIPLAETTLIDWEKVDGSYSVQFFLQKGTAITDATNPSLRRAYWAIKLPSKQTCKTFISLFERLKAESPKS